MRSRFCGDPWEERYLRAQLLTGCWCEGVSAKALKAKCAWDREKGFDTVLTLSNRKADIRGIRYVLAGPGRDKSHKL